MVDEKQELIESYRERYERDLHAVQSGIKQMMELDPKFTTPKHLRVGIDSCFASMLGLVELLLAKGVINEVEYHQYQMEAMEKEKVRYEQMLSEMLGVGKVTLH